MSERDRAFDPDGGGTTALAVSAGGVGALLLGWLLRSRVLRWLGLLAAVAGGGLYARAKLTERGEKIGVAETSIRSELDDLDPVARAQALEDIARSEL